MTEPLTIEEGKIYRGVESDEYQDAIEAGTPRKLAAEYAAEAAERAVEAHRKYKRRKSSKANSIDIDP